jgi:site-specific DNA recombinase
MGLVGEDFIRERDALRATLALLGPDASTVCGSWTTTHLGRQVWNRQRRDEVLIDVDDVALCHETRMRWNDRTNWVWSAEPTHEAIVNPETFTAAERVASVGGQRRTEQKRHTSERRYLLSGLVHCGVCNRRMQGQQNHGASYYRCRFPPEYALTAELAHPRNVYLAEQTVIPALDTWLARLFDADHIDETCKILAGVSEPDPSAAIRHETARRRLSACSDRLAKYRRALDAGVDAEVVGAWIREVQADHLRAEADLAAPALRRRSARKTSRHSSSTCARPSASCARRSPR